MEALRELLQNILGQPVSAVRKLQVSDWATVYQVEGGDGARFAAKVPNPGAPSSTETEAFMLQFLAEKTALPVPDVIAHDETILVMEFIETDGRLDVNAQKDLARHMAALHSISAEKFGFDRDTIFGPLDQPNGWMDSWIDFFIEHRLLHIGRLAAESGRMDRDVLSRLERLASNLDQYIPDGIRPSLLHGDLWTGNVLVRDGKLAALIDPAIYYGHAEMDLAFSTLFGTTNSNFFNEYRNLRPVADGFFEIRRDIYNLWPLLVHVRLFGGGYLAQVKSILAGLGY